jgi:hypothetical protein
LKENVIVGRLVPAGTGLPEYREVYVRSPRQTQEIKDMALANAGSSEKAPVGEK